MTSRLQGSSINSVRWEREPKSSVSGGMEEHCLRRYPWSERHRTALLARFRVLHNLLQHEHDRGRRHVAKMREDVAGMCKGIRGQVEALLNCIENGAAAWVHCPEIKRERIFSAGDVGAYFLHRAADLGGHLTGKLHVKTHFADAPRDQAFRFGNAESEEAVYGEADFIRADDACRATIGEEQEREHLLQVVRLLKVQ